MATYITMLNFTQQGVENIKDAPDRLAAASQAFEAMGAEMKQFFLTMGRYDAVVIIEAPDAETVAKLALTIGSQGNVQTETLRAFSQDEFLDIVSGLP